MLKFSENGVELVGIFTIKRDIYIVTFVKNRNTKPGALRGVYR